MNLCIDNIDYKIKLCKKNISFYKKELKRLNSVNMCSKYYVTDKGYKFLTDKYYIEYSNLLIYYKKQLKELKNS